MNLNKIHLQIIRSPSQPERYRRGGVFAPTEEKEASDAPPKLPTNLRRRCNMIKLGNVNKTYYGGSPLHVLKGINLEVAKANWSPSWAPRVRASPRYSISSAFSTTTTAATTISLASSSKTSTRPKPPPATT